MNTYKFLMIMMNGILDDNIIYIISKYIGKKWTINRPKLKQIKVKNTQRSKQNYSFHYYYH